MKTNIPSLSKHNDVPEAAEISLFHTSPVLNNQSEHYRGYLKYQTYKSELTAISQNITAVI